MITLNPSAIIQAPMAGAHDAELTIAVCQAGGIGSLPAAMLSAEKLCHEIERIQQAIPSQLYNINFFAHQTPTVSNEELQRWLALLNPYLQEYQIDPDLISTAPGRQPFNEESLAIIEHYRPPIVSFHFGLPEMKLLQAVKATGAQVWSSATSVAEARWLESRGVDAIIAQGFEAGGHRGMFLETDVGQQMGLWSLLPNIVRVVKCPVIAAGGISNSTMVHMALQLGAKAVQVGTAFLLAYESKINPQHRAALQSSRAEHTVITNLLSGRYARGIANRFIAECGPISADALAFPLASNAVSLLKTASEKLGKDDFSSLWAGQNALLNKEGSAQEIVQRLTSI